ncbi:MAG: TolA-binding protein [Pseudoalteromonas tetraodonis]|jgi:TolA-binding protein
MTPKKIVVLNIAILALGLGLWLVSKWGDMDVIAKFGTFLLFTVAIALFSAMFVLPAVGEWIGNFFYSAPEEVEPDKYGEAASKLAQGDYEGAIKTYRAVAKDEPDSRFPLVEIAKIQQEHLHDGEAAITTIQAALDSKEWPENDAAFFMFRLADLYHTVRSDVDTAKGFLNQVMEAFPETRHSANARHKLNELDRQ